MSEKRKIAEATLIIGVFAVLGKLLGFVREIIIAAFFGTTYKTDAFFIGLAGPDFIREIISGSILTAVFIPVYTASLASKNDEESKKLLNTIATLLIAALVIAAVLGFPLAPLIVRLIAPELDALTFGLAVEITRIIFPAIIFMGLASFYGSLLNVRKHFLTPSLSQLMLNIGIIAGVVLLTARYGVKSLAYGFVAGAMLQLLVMIPSLKEKSVSYKFELKLTPEIKKMFMIGVPLFFATFVATANDLVSRSLATGIGEGNVAGITFANRIRETIWLLCAVPLGTAVFPYLSEYAAKNDLPQLEKTVSFSIRFTAFLALPLCLIMLFYSQPIVRLLFQRGQFDFNSTLITSSALMYFSLGALFYSLNFVILRVYYSIQDSRTPLIIYSGAFVINLAAGILLRKEMMVGGIALARSISDLAAFILLAAFLIKKYPLMKFDGILKNLSKITAIALISVVFSFIAFGALAESGHIIKLAAAFSVFAAAYLGFSLLFGIDEVQAAKRELLKKFS